MRYFYVKVKQKLEKGAKLESIKKEIIVKNIFLKKKIKFDSIDLQSIHGLLLDPIRLQSENYWAFSGPFQRLPLLLVSYQPNPRPYVQGRPALQFLYPRYRIKQRILSARPEFPQT